MKPRAGSDDRLYIDLGPSADKKHPSRNRFDGTVRECEAILRYWGLLPRKSNAGGRK